MQALDLLYYTLAFGFLVLIGAIVAFVFYAWTTLRIIRSTAQSLKESHLKLGMSALGTIGILLNFLKRR